MSDTAPASPTTPPPAPGMGMKIVTLVLLFSCGFTPVGLILMWVKGVFSMGARVVLTGLSVLLMLAFIVPISGSAQRRKERKAAEAAAAAASVPAPAAVAAPSPSAPTPAPAPAPAPAAAPTPETAPAAPTVPAFVVDRQSACETYKSAKNEIQASETFTQYLARAGAKRARLDKVAGTLRQIETSHGGGTVLVKVETEYGTFTNNDALQENLLGDKQYEIRKGSPLYKSLAAFAEGAPVLVTLAGIVPQRNMFSEKLSVCGDDWVAQFVSIQAAQ